jgi:hypothetical protein
MAQDLANRASEAGRQAMDRAGEFVEGVAPQAKEVASNLYDRGARSGEYVRQYAVQDPLAAMLVAGVIGFTLRAINTEGDPAGRPGPQPATHFGEEPQAIAYR